MINVAFFSAKRYDEKAFAPLLEKFAQDLNVTFFESPLNPDTASLATQFDAVCVFVNDQVDAQVLRMLADSGTKHVALRCAGFNNIDLEVAKQCGIEVSRVPAYSPEAVAEHTVGLILTLGRKLHKAYNRVREGNFELDGLQGLTLHKKTVGIIGTGHIGLATLKILNGFGCKLLCYDIKVNPEALALGAQYVSLDEIYKTSDIISLHCPLLEATHHLINDDSLAKMKDGVMIINTSRGGLVDTGAAIGALKRGKIGFLGLDVYEMESDLFFRDLSETIIHDDLFARLGRFHNVIITGHQGFFTYEALDEIAHVTISNILNQSKGELRAPFKLD